MRANIYREPSEVVIFGEDKKTAHTHKITKHTNGCMSVRHNPSIKLASTLPSAPPSFALLTVDHQTSKYTNPENQTRQHQSLDFVQAKIHFNIPPGFWPEKHQVIPV